MITERGAGGDPRRLVLCVGVYMYAMMQTGRGMSECEMVKFMPYVKGDGDGGRSTIGGMSAAGPNASLGVLPLLLLLRVLLPHCCVRDMTKSASAKHR